MASPLWTRAMSSDGCHAEVPFAMRLGGEGGPRVLHGVIDLAFRTDDAWDLVDYKTDQADIDGLAARYAGQVRAYAEHWRTLAAAPIRYAGLFGGREVKLTGSLLAP